MKLLAVSGVDGSGKTTFINEVRSLLVESSPGSRIGTAWLRFNPRAAGTGTQSPGGVSTLDVRHKGHPLKRLAKVGRVSGAWVSANAVIYERQLRWQMASRQDLDILLADRFTLDFIADNIGAGMMEISGAEKVFRKLPKPDAYVVLDVSDANLERRKDPRESLSALSLRRDLYRSLANELALPLVDTTELDWRERVRRILLDRGVL